MTEIKRHFFSCGCCEAHHSIQFFGDCRDNSQRFHAEELDEAFGPDGWLEVEQECADDYLASERKHFYGPPRISGLPDRPRTLLQADLEGGRL